MTKHLLNLLPLLALTLLPLHQLGAESESESTGKKNENPDPKACCACIEIEANQAKLSDDDPEAPDAPVTDPTGNLKVNVSVSVLTGDECSNVVIDSAVLRPVGQDGITVPVDLANSVAFVPSHYIRHFGTDWEVAVYCSEHYDKSNKRADLLLKKVLAMLPSFR